MHISVIGAGYVGLVTAACFAELGNEVICVDVDESKIKTLQKGKIPIFEPGLDDLVQRNLKEKRLSFTTEIRPAVEKSLVIFIAVGTPPKEDGSADLSYIAAVARQIAENMNGYKVVVNKSTVPVGSAKWVTKIIAEHAPLRSSFSVVSNPEFLREGAGIEDFMRPNRVIIGSDSDEASAIMKELYSPLYLLETPFVITNLASAELTKYAANAFLATKISFINEMANFCELVGGDVHAVARGMGLDKRIGTKFLHPGPGYGGSCFPKDVRALIEIGREHDHEFEIASAVDRVNSRQRQLMLSKILETVGSVEGKTLGVLGLSFKPNTDDIREAPALDIIRALIEQGAKVRAFDPEAMDNTRPLLGDIDYCADMYEPAVKADALIVFTEWNQFRSLDLTKLKSVMKSPVVVDLRNIYNPEKMLDLGFKYACVGRPGELFD